MPNGICGGYSISPNTDCRRWTRLASTFECCTDGAGGGVNIPTGSAASPRCRCRTPRPRRPSWSVPLPNSDSAGRWSTTACSGQAGAISTHANTMRCGRHWNPLGCGYVCTPAPAGRAMAGPARTSRTVGASWSWAAESAGTHCASSTAACSTGTPSAPRHQRRIHHQRVFSPATILGAVMEVGADAVLFSVDYPYESSAHAVAGLERTTLSASDRDARSRQRRTAAADLTRQPVAHELLTAVELGR